MRRSFSLPPASPALFLWLIPALAWDLTLVLFSPAPAVVWAADGVFFVFLALRFSAWRVKKPENLLKLCYLVIAFAFRFLWSITLFFLIVYERLAQKEFFE